MAKHFFLPFRPLIFYALVFTLLWVQSVCARSTQLVRRGATTNAFCRPEFAWMNNSKQQSPCLVGAYLLAPCRPTGNGNVQAINTTYIAPTAEGAEACWCSWGVYNTLEACAACQNNQTYLLSWYNYRTNCTKELQPNTEFYPSDNAISEETAVPFWATMNPALWDSGTFNVSQAQALAEEGKEDVTQESRTAASGTASASSSASATETSDTSDDNSSSNVGAIAGGVAGGTVAIIAVAGLFAFFFMRRKKKTKPQWDYKEQDITVAPFFPTGPPGSQPLIGGYPELGESTNTVRVQTGSNMRVDLASPVEGRSASAGYYTGSSEYDGRHAFAATTSSSSGADPHQPNPLIAEPSPPPYSDTGVVLRPMKER